MNNSDDAQEYLIILLKDNVCTRSLSFNDLGWCEEVRVCPPFEKPIHISF